MQKRYPRFHISGNLANYSLESKGYLKYGLETSHSIGLDVLEIEISLESLNL